ncbi:hypothetical protein OQA88_4631 [Cercophora sp. LCS_1]
MKFSTIIPLAAAATASPLIPTPAIRPMLPIDVFNVTRFGASSIPHSTSSTLGFNITVTSISPSTECSGYAPGYQWVGNFPVTNCSEPTVAFSLTRGENNSATLDIFWRLGDKGLMQGTHYIPGSQFEYRGEHTSVKNIYVGPSDFTISNLTLVRSIWGDD